MKNGGRDAFHFSADDIAASVAAKLWGTIKVIALTDAINEYHEYIKRLRAEKTITGFVTFKRHLLKYFSPIKTIDTITQKDMEDFLFYLSKNAPLAVNNYLRIGRAFFNVLKRWGYIRQNPFIGIQLPQRQQCNPAYYSINEAQLIWNKLDEMEKPIIKHIVKIGFFTAMRYGELTNLRWRNIDLKEKLITVGDDSFTTKTKKIRIIPMNDIVFELLKELKINAGSSRKTDEQFVFCRKNKKGFTVNHVSKQFKKAVRALGMSEGIHLYSTRHSAASHLISRGANLYAIKEIMGHANFSTTQLYTHLGMDDLRKAVER